MESSRVARLAALAPIAFVLLLASPASASSIAPSFSYSTWKAPYSPTSVVAQVGNASLGCAAAPLPTPISFNRTFGALHYLSSDSARSCASSKLVGGGGEALTMSYLNVTVKVASGSGNSTFWLATQWVLSLNWTVRLGTCTPAVNSSGGCDWVTWAAVFPYFTVFDTTAGHREVGGTGFSTNFNYPAYTNDTHCAPGRCGYGRFGTVLVGHASFSQSYTIQANASLTSGDALLVQMGLLFVLISQVSDYHATLTGASAAVRASAEAKFASLRERY